MTGGNMGIYNEYLDRRMTFDELEIERKNLLKRISEIRGRNIVVYAGDNSKSGPGFSTAIDSSDTIPFYDQLSFANGTEIDLILETPGGFAEIVEELVRFIRSKYNKFGVIIPGRAQSAGTIFVMAADEILMGQTSALGPIDAQIARKGKRFSAGAFLDGLKKIVDVANKNQSLDLAYVPILREISPGEIQDCENAQAFSQTLVTQWLTDYKFKFWDKHTSDGRPVTYDEKQQRAQEIAAKLADPKKWLTHGRALNIDDLRELKLIIEDYSKNEELNDAITRYFTLLRMSFETNVYKIYETPESQIYRSIQTQPNVQIPVAPPQVIQNPSIVQFQCDKCGSINSIQANFDHEFPLNTGCSVFPKDNNHKCLNCGQNVDIGLIRQELENQTGKKIV
jgi:ClpP class serine protease